MSSDYNQGYIDGQNNGLVLGMAMQPLYVVNEKKDGTDVFVCNDILTVIDGIAVTETGITSALVTVIDGIVANDTLITATAPLEFEQGG